MLAVIGIEHLMAPPSSKRWPLHVGVCLSIGCFGPCVAGALYWPDELKSVIPKGQPGLSLAEIQSAFLAPYWYQLGWQTVAWSLWASVFFHCGERSRRRLAVAVLMVLESISHVWNLHPQPDPRLYYPRIPALEFIQKSLPGRVLGVKCLPPKLLESHQLQDIRGYDGVDPLPYIQLLSLAFDGQWISALEYAKTMWYVPIFQKPVTATESFRLHPVLNMLGLRYIIFQQPVELRNPAFQDDDYTVFVNSHAMPRAWVPKSVRIVSSENAVLESMLDWNFDPSSESYLTSLPSALPDHCSGTVKLIDQNPQLLLLTAKMDTVGLVVVGDRYDSDWHVTVDGQPHPLLCVNHALRGVLLSQGEHSVEMHYLPVAFSRGVTMFCCASIVMITLAVWSFRSRFHRMPAIAGNTV